MKCFWQIALRQHAIQACSAARCVPHEPLNQSHTTLPNVLKGHDFPIGRYVYYFSQTQQKYKCRSLQFILIQLQLLECVLQTYYIESWTDYIILLCSWAQASTAEYRSQVAKEHWPKFKIYTNAANWARKFTPKGAENTKNAPNPKMASQNLHWPQIPTMLHICTTASQIRTPLH